MAVCVLCLFLTVPWVGQQYVTVEFPGYTNIVLLYLSSEITIAIHACFITILHICIKYLFYYSLKYAQHRGLVIGLNLYPLLRDCMIMNCKGEKDVRTGWF